MDTGKLAEELLKLKKEFDEHGPDTIWRTRRTGAITQIMLCKWQVQYEKLKAKNPDLQSVIFESSTPISAEHREDLRKAVAINRQIGRSIGELRKARKAKGDKAK